MKCIGLSKLLVVALLIAVQSNTFAQANDQISLTDVKGTPLTMHKAFDVEGSPFYMPDYCKADIKIAKGKTYEGVLVKLNLQDNNVYFKMANEQEMIATVPVEYIVFTGCYNSGDSKVFKAGFPVIDKQSEKTFYEVLSEGNVSLLKHQTVTYRDNIPYGSTVNTRIYEKKQDYYAYSPAKGIVKLKDTDVAVQLLADHGKQVKNFINEQNIKVKKELDLMRLFVYYNSL